MRSKEMKFGRGLIQSGATARHHRCYGEFIIRHHVYRTDVIGFGEEKAEQSGTDEPADSCATRPTILLCITSHTAIGIERSYVIHLGGMMR